MRDTERGREESFAAVAGSSINQNLEEIVDWPKKEALEVTELAYCLGYGKNRYIIGAGLIGEEEKAGPLRFVTQNGALHYLPIFESYLHLLTR